MAKTMSLKPSDMAVGGGGILHDVDVRFDTVRFGKLTYSGKGQPAPALMVNYTDLDTGESYEQGWTIGNKDDYVPAGDGLSIVTDKPLRLSSNMGQLWKSLADNIGEEKFGELVDEGGITVLEGLECHMIQIPDTRPTAKPRKDPKTGKEYPPTIPVVDEIRKAPWDKKGKGGGKEDAGSKTAGDSEQATIEFIKATLAGSKDGMAQNPLAIAAFQHFKDDGDLATIAATLIHDEKFISAIDGVTFKDGVLKEG